MEYERLTKKCDLGIGLTRTSGNITEDYIAVVNRLAELEDKIENKKLVFIPEYVEKYAIVKYTFWKKQPLDIATYYPCGIKMNGDIDYRYSGIKSGNIMVIEDGFGTKEAAQAKLKELSGAK